MKQFVPFNHSVRSTDENIKLFYCASLIWVKWIVRFLTFPYFVLLNDVFRWFLTTPVSFLFKKYTSKTPCIDLLPIQTFCLVIFKSAKFVFLIVEYILYYILEHRQRWRHAQFKRWLSWLTGKRVPLKPPLPVQRLPIRLLEPQHHHDVVVRVQRLNITR